jgi:hypothetical protein
VTVGAFESERGADWRRLSEALARAGGRPERLGADGVQELGRLYRRAAADLAYARRRYPGDPVVGRLEALVIAGRGTVYGQGRRGGSVREFLLRGYWQRRAPARGRRAIPGRRSGWSPPHSRRRPTRRPRAVTTTPPRAPRSPRR